MFFYCCANIILDKKHRMVFLMIGRINEKKYLQSLLNEEETQFVSVFGRRRIGKTYLVRESFDSKGHDDGE